MALIKSVGDPTLTVGLSFAAIYAKLQSTECLESNDQNLWMALGLVT